MRLISLEANRDSFKKVNFNRVGLTLVVGRHRLAKKANLKKTYNGVGKSLIVALIDYCLCSNKNDQFDAHLPDWTFTLTFEHAGRQHRLSRTTGDPQLVFDDAELGLKQCRERFQELGVFLMPPVKVAYLTFKSLMAFFLRPKAASYVQVPTRPQPDWTDYQSVLCQSFLLGIDYQRSVEKHDQKKRLDQYVTLAERYQKDKELELFMVENAEVELIELDTEISRLSADLEAFRVAENYSERERQADLLHNRLMSVGNEMVVQQNLISDLQAAMNVSLMFRPRPCWTFLMRAQRQFQSAS